MVKKFKSNRYSYAKLILEWLLTKSFSYDRKSIEHFSSEEEKYVSGLNSLFVRHLKTIEHAKRFSVRGTKTHFANSDGFAHIFARCRRRTRNNRRPWCTENLKTELRRSLKFTRVQQARLLPQTPTVSAFR